MNYKVLAEWERQKSITVVFPTNQKDWQYCINDIQHSYVKFINALRTYQKCIVLIHDKKILNKYFNDFTNIEIIELQTNDTWIRDFGAIDLYENDKLISYNFIFNAWGDKFEASLDKQINSKLDKLDFYKHPLKNIDFILEGGSIDSNGDNVLLTTAKCIYNKNRNNTLRHKDIDKKIIQLFGLNQLIILKNGGLIGDDTDSHIDTLARFINKNCIAYATCSDERDEHYDELKKMEKELQNTNFELLPIPLPKAQFFKCKRLPATYLNFVFINDALIVPTYDDICDELVLDIFKKRFSNNAIVGVDARVFIREHGSLHCASINQFY